MSTVLLAVASTSALFLLFEGRTAYEMRISDWSSDGCYSDLLIQFVRSPAPPSGIALMRSPKVPETAENTSCSSRKGTLPTRRMGVRASLIQSSSFLYRCGPGSGKVQHFQLLRWSQDRSLPDFRAHPRAGTGSAELRHSGLCLSRIRNFVGAPGERGAPPSHPPFATGVSLCHPEERKSGG